MHKSAALLSLSFVVAACCGGPSGKIRKYDTPTADSIVVELKNRQALTKSFLAESRMEYWVKDERIKTTVYVMGKEGARVRFNASIRPGALPPTSHVTVTILRLSTSTRTANSPVRVPRPPSRSCCE